MNQDVINEIKQNYRISPTDILKTLGDMGLQPTFLQDQDGKNILNATIEKVQTGMSEVIEHVS